MGEGSAAIQRGEGLPAGGGGGSLMTHSAGSKYCIQIFDGFEQNR